MHRLVTVACVLLVSMAHSLGYYASRSQLYVLALQERGLPSSELSTLYATQSSASILGIFLSIPLSALLGPGAAMAAGLLVYGLGAALLGAGGASLPLAMITCGLGLGLYRPALWAALCRPFGTGWESGRTAAALAVYAGVNLVAIPASGLGELLAQTLGPSAVMLASGALSAAMALVALGPVAFQFASGAPETEADLARGLSLPVLAVAGGTALVAGLGIAGTTLANDLQYLAAYGSGEIDWLYLVNPAVVLLACALGVLALGAAQLAGLRVPSLALLGGGLVVSALALLPSGLLSGGGMALALGAIVVGALGEAFIFAPAFARACGEVHWRASIVPAAVLTLASTAPAALSGLLSSLGGWGATGLAIVPLLAGIACLAAAWPVRRMLEAGEQEPEGKLDAPGGGAHDPAR